MQLFNMHVIFFEIPRIEELQDPDSSPRREEVGRRTLRELMEASYSHFLSGQGFRESRALLENVKLGKCILIRLQSPREWKNRTRLDEYYFFYYLIPPEDDL
jgi:hypothetical protein